MASSESNGATAGTAVAKYVPVDGRGGLPVFTGYTGPDGRPYVADGVEYCGCDACRAHAACGGYLKGGQCPHCGEESLVLCGHGVVIDTRDGGHKEYTYAGAELCAGHLHGWTRCASCRRMSDWAGKVPLHGGPWPILGGTGGVEAGA